MKIFKNLSFILCSFILVLTGLFFVGCGETDYSKMSLVATVNDEKTNSITIEVGDTVDINFTIVNFSGGMNGELDINASFDAGNKCFDFKQNNNQQGQTTVNITGLSGGNGHLNVSTKEGGMRCNVDILVGQYSHVLGNSSTNLYLTENTDFVPNSGAFKFDKESNKRDLEYYFFGTTQPSTPLTLDNIRDSNENFTQGFTKVSLYLDNATGNRYLIFTDKNQNLFTLQNTETGTQNTKINFIPARVEGEGFAFDGAAKPVSLGDKFTFVAYYPNPFGEEIFVQRDFYVLRDLNGSQITYSYQFESSNPDPKTYSNQDVYLIPNRRDIDGNNWTHYNNMTFTLVLPTDSTLVKLALTNPTVNNEQVAIVEQISAPVYQNGKTIYTIAIQNKIDFATEATLAFKIYYEGYENVNDENVNYTLSVPLHIVYLPEHITVNEQPQITEPIIFYNQYAAGFGGGWKDFDIQYDPTDAVFSRLEIRYNADNLMIQYGGRIHDEYRGQTTIRLSKNELSNGVKFKGRDRAQVVADQIVLTLFYSVLEEPEQHLEEYRIPYQIIEGPTQIDTDDTLYKSDGIFMSLGQTKDFTALYANERFENITVTFRGDNEGSEDCVDITTFDAGNEDGKYYLGLRITAKEVCRGLYQIQLDNGTSITLWFEVVESLESVAASVQGVNQSVTETVFTKGDEEPDMTSIYIRNRTGSFNEVANLTFVANENEHSSAITSVRPSQSGTGFHANSPQIDENGMVNISIVTSALGNGKITYTIYGKGVDNQFHLDRNKQLTYEIEIISYADITSIDLFKTHAGLYDYDESDRVPAGNVFVYYSTTIESLRTVNLFVAPGNEGYLFYDPLGQGHIENANDYDREFFDLRYVTWRAENYNISRLDAGGQTVPGIKEMVYNPAGSNIYIIEGIGRFDTENLTFEAFDYHFTNFELTAYVRQFDRLHAKTLTISSIEYNGVSRVSTDELSDELNLTASRTRREIVIYATPSDATKPDITVIFEPKSEEAREFFGGFTTFSVSTNAERGDFVRVEDFKNGIFVVTFNLDPAFLTSDAAKSETADLSGNLVFASTDWLAGESVPERYLASCVERTISFANGSLKNPFLLETPEDVAAINPSMNYRISSTIDLGMLSNEAYYRAFPIVDFSGTIVGSRDQAEIKGIRVSLDYSSDKDKSNVGLFTTIADGARIEGVKFSGKIDISITGTQALYNIGLLAGTNYGKLINIGVEFDDDSTIKVESGASINSGIYIGGVVGQNKGWILQDYTQYVGQGNLSGQTPNILMYNNKTLKFVNASGRNINLYIGGVVGFNDANNIQEGQAATFDYMLKGRALSLDRGSIVKIDEPSLKLFGYSGYISYTNIVVDSAPDSSSTMASIERNIGGVAGKSTGKILAYISNNDGAKLYNNTNYSAGKGIAAGGSIVDESFVNASNDSFKQNIGGIVGDIEVPTVDYFTGITARVNVLGSKNVGAISGNFTIGNNDAAISNTPAFFMQAVDDGRVGFEASMIAVIRQSITEFPKKDDLNYLAFSTDDFKFNFMAKKDYTNVLSYVERECIGQFRGTNSTDYYYGDFVVAQSLTGPFVCNLEFADGTDEDIKPKPNPNGRFAQFTYIDETGESANATDMFYMYYFHSLGYDFQSANADITESQTFLDENFNTVAPGSLLYPLDLAEGMILTSMSDTLSIDQSGRIVVNRADFARIRISSVLNINNAVSFYIYAVNYFNNDAEEWVVYPTSSPDGPYKNDSIIELRGDSRFNMYVIPTVDTEVEGILKIENGVLLDRMNVVLDKNQVITAKMKVYKYNTVEKGDPTIVYDSENPIKDPHLDVTISGQTISLQHNDKTLEYYNNLSNKYIVEITPVIRATRNGRDYICEVNKKIDDMEARYYKGARSIEQLNHNSTSMQISDKIEERIRVISSYPDPSIDSKYEGMNENDPTYTIEKDGQTLYTKESGKDGIGDEIFYVKFVSSTCKKNNDSGLYEYIFNVEITFNTSCQAYQNRGGDDENLYGQYYIRFYAKTDPAKSTILKINLERTFVNKIVAGNYSDITKLESGESNFSSTSGVGIPGKRGLLAITLTPADADFDYITIENDLINSQEGNSMATFALVGLDKNSLSSENGGKLKFNETVITGEVISRGVRFNLSDIIRVYSNENVSYDGRIFVRYNLSSVGVAQDGKSSFVITTHTMDKSKPKPVDVTTSIKVNLALRIEFHAYVGLVGKEGTLGEGETYKSYQVARGLRYELTYEDIWGFSPQDVTLTISNDSLAKIVEEDGRIFVEITKDQITYNQSQYATVNIIANAQQTVGEITRTGYSLTRLMISEFVLNYNYEINQNADIVSQMDGGTVNVRIGSTHTLAVDMSEFVEVDDSISTAVQAVREFYQQMTTTGKWRVYANLLVNGQNSSNEVINPDDLEDLPYKQDIQANSDYSNYYMFVKNYNITPRRIHDSTRPYYMFTFDGFCRLENGRYVALSEKGDRENVFEVKTRFTFNVYQATSEEDPNPVYSFEDLVNMQAPNDYILMDDIVIPNAQSQEIFTPISTEIASFDGNGYAFKFSGLYDFGDATRLALFDEISEDTIIKNVRIELDSNVSFRTTSSSAFDAALLAASNSGTITNCSVVGTTNGEAHTLTFLVENKQNRSYTAGLVARNSGAITNCQSSVNITSEFNTAGLVGVNNGHIASSYFAGGKLNLISVSHSMGGLVVENNDAATISTSYVLGENSRDSIYSTSEDFKLTSDGPQAGFVYQNLGDINDCYSNIRIENRSRAAAGFVNQNGGTITNCFSLSTFYSSELQIANRLAGDVNCGGFARTDTVEDGTTAGDSVFDNCYYFQNDIRDAGDSHTGAYQYNINTSLAQVTFTGVTPLNRRGFEFGTVEDEADDENPFYTTFASYAIDGIDDPISTLDRLNYRAVWFYATENQTSSVFGNKAFANGRLELVAPNIVTGSRRVISDDRTVTDEESGDIHYEYDYFTGRDAETGQEFYDIGEINNPFLLKDAQSFENHLLENSNPEGYNYENYRVVNDINYSDYNQPSKLYKIIYCGMLEGNGFTISGISLNSAESLESAGLFAQIGMNISRVGIVKNLTLIPSRNISFNNASKVGGIAGKLSYGYLSNVRVERPQATADDEGTIIAGANMVGAIVGYADERYKIFNASSNLSVVANFRPSDSLLYETNAPSTRTYSYAGGLVGYAGGQGSIVNSSVSDNYTLMGAVAGFAFGGVGNNVTVTKLSVSPSADSVIRAYANGYAGMVAGEVRGTLDLVVVENSAGANYKPFSLSLNIPLAVGGITGTMIGGSISRAKIEQGWETTQIISTDTQGTSGKSKIEVVGGVIGLAQSRAIELEQIVVDASISACRILGGVVGQADVSIDMKEIAVKSENLTISGYENNSYLGGFVGFQSGSVARFVTAADCYVNTTLTTDTYVYASSITANVGYFFGNGGPGRMERCYATGNIETTLVDRRLAMGAEDKKEYSASSGQVQIAGKREENAFDDIKDAPDSQAEYDNASVKDVYFLGDMPGGSQTFDYKLNTNAAIASCTLNLNFVGTSSTELANYFYGTGGVGGHSQALNNLFDYYINSEQEYKYSYDNKAFYAMPKTNVQGQCPLYYVYDAATGNYYEHSDTSKATPISPALFVEIDDSTHVHYNLKSIWKINNGGLSTLLFEDMFTDWLK